MNYLKQAFIELLSGLTTKKNEKEVWVKNEFGHPITVESIDDENYIIRTYWENGRVHWVRRYKNERLLCHTEIYDRSGRSMV